MAGCADEEVVEKVGVNVEEGIPVTLRMSYNALMPQVVLSRAAGDEGNNPRAIEDKGYGLHVFVFSETTGKLTGYKYITQNEFHANYSEFTEFDENYQKKENLGTGLNKNAVVEIKTLTGRARIYAVANPGMANYNVPELLTYLNNGSINEDAYLNGHETVTLDWFQKLTFKGEPKLMVNDIVVNEEDLKMLMSGGYERGEVCTIGIQENKIGAIYKANGNLDPEPIIQLRRVLTKVKLNINLHSSNTTATFVPQNYSIHNIASEGMMLPQTDCVTQNTDFTTSGDYTYVDRKDVKYTIEQLNMRKDNDGENTTQQTGAWFEIIIPENRQVAVNNCNTWHMREDNKYTGDTKTFTNAPEKGTYVVIKGDYKDESLQRIADVSYTIHLGDFSTAKVGNNNNYSDFNLNRNWEYKYNVYIKNVSDIVVEAHTLYTDGTDPNEPAPGAEGLVVDFGNGKAFVVDSHYEAVVMKITKADTYSFNTEVPAETGGKLISENIVVYADKGADEVDNVFQNAGITDYQHKWLEFVRLDKLQNRFAHLNWPNVNDNKETALKAQMASLKYEPKHSEGGNVPFMAYTYTSPTATHTTEGVTYDNDYTDLYADENGGDILLRGVDAWFKDLMADEDGWTKETSADGKEIETRTYICFINEHYYIKNEAGVTGGTWDWDQYTNTDKERYFNFYNDYYESQDNNSKHLKVSYSIEQKAIWTFYNPDYAKGNKYANYKSGNHSENIRAYGVEYYSDEELFDDDCDGEQDRLANENQPETIAADNWTTWWGSQFDICDVGCDQKKDNPNFKAYTETGGRYNSLNDMCWGGNGYTDNVKIWAQIMQEDVDLNTDNTCKNLHYLHLAFIYRNRDLDRDGLVDNNDVRWYTPSINQYAGMWIGENVFPAEAKLYHETSYANAALQGGAFSNLQKSEVRHFFSSTPGMRTFWGEEAFSFGSYKGDTNDPHFVRCIRTIASGLDGLKNDNGYFEADPYYIYDEDTRTFDLEYMTADGVLSLTPTKTEIKPHHERQLQNNASRKFKVAHYRVGQLDESGNVIKHTVNGVEYNQAPTAYSIYAITQQHNNENDLYSRLYNDDGVELTPTDTAVAPLIVAPSIHNEGGEVGWRIPNHREFGLMMLESRNMEAQNIIDYNANMTAPIYTYDGDDYLVTSFANLNDISDWTDDYKAKAVYNPTTKQWYVPILYMDIIGNSTVGQRKNIRNDACRTHCSNIWYRKGYHSRRNGDGTFILSMIGNGDNWDNIKFFIRPVMDVE